MKKRIAGLVAAAALATGGFTAVGSVTSAAPAEAYQCGATYLYSAKNQYCASVQHFNWVSGKRSLAPWVAKGKTSSQAVCAVGAKDPNTNIKP